MHLRHRLHTLALALSLGLLFACSQAPERIPQREVVLELRGVDCEGCAQKVSTALRSVQGVAWAQIDPEFKQARVTCAESTDPAALVRAVRGAGAEYGAKHVEQ